MFNLGVREEAEAEEILTKILEAARMETRKTLEAKNLMHVLTMQRKKRRSKINCKAGWC